MSPASYGPFTSVADIFTAGTEGLGDEELLMVENFGLHDSMSAVEIMDPRMDSGMTTTDSPKTVFDPLMPVLPEEVCWILDQALACEMTWHAGYTLTQTVYTCRYVHQLRELGSGFADKETWIDDLRRNVLCPAIYGVLKSCDLSWRQLSKGHVIDTEDWNSEKADVSLAEGVQLNRVLHMLQDALDWLDITYEISNSPWKERLKMRINLRIALLHLLSEAREEYAQNIALAKEHLSSIISQPQPDLPPNSRVHAVFDRAINRELPSFLPLPPIACLTIPETWVAVECFILGREVLVSLGTSDSLIHWRITALVNSYIPIAPSSNWLPVTRSLAMSMFFTESEILQQQSPSWIVDQFLYEFGNVPNNSLFSYADSLGNMLLSNFQSPTQIVEDFESDLAKLLVNFHVACFHNRARQRRNLANAIVHWHRTYDFCLSIFRKLGIPKTSVLQRIPLILQCQHLDMVRELIFSGFELEIYSEYELSWIYWYIFGPLSNRHQILNKLLCLIKTDTDHPNLTETFLAHEMDLMKGLSSLALAMAQILARRLVKHPLDRTREQLNFERRFKWALSEDYDTVRTPDPAKPDFEGYNLWKDAFLLGDEWQKYSIQLISDAHTHFQAMQSRGDEHGLFRHCSQEWQNLVRSLTSICEAFISVGQDSGHDLSVVKLEWKHSFVNWFPIPVLEG